MGLRDSATFEWNLLSGTIVVLLSGLALRLAIRRWSSDERLLVGLAFAGHVVASYVLLWVIQTLYGIGDVISFFRQGELLVRYIDLGTPGALSDTLALIFQRTVRLPFAIIGSGSPTGTMSGTGAILLLATRSLWSGNLLAALLATSGQIAIFAVFREQFGHALRPRVAIATLLVPSVVFWTSGLVKEAFALGALGWALLGLWRLSERRFRLGVPATVLGLVGIGLTKPYLLMPLSVSSAVWLYWRYRARREGLDFALRPWRLTVAAGMAGVAVIVVGELFPAYSFENLGEQAALQQQYGTLAGGGSYYQLGDARADRTLLGQLTFAPMGLISAWFRPFLFEASNVVMLLNALESTSILLLSMRIMVRFGPVETWKSIRQNPALMFCLAFSVVTGVGVGITSTNLGSLSRYRSPLMPFLATMLVVLDATRTRAPAQRGARSASQASVTRSMV